MEHKSDSDKQVLLDLANSHPELPEAYVCIPLLSAPPSPIQAPYSPSSFPHFHQLISLASLLVPPLPFPPSSCSLPHPPSGHLQIKRRPNRLLRRALPSSLPPKLLLPPLLLPSTLVSSPNRPLRRAHGEGHQGVGAEGRKGGGGAGLGVSGWESQNGGGEEGGD
jgi:hypothetical protein